MARPTSRGRIRIIGGRWRGRRIAFPDVEGLRPTPDRVRETLFNWLAPYVAGARVLDLFAGSGILGLEALSRGAASLVAVESNRRVASWLRDAGTELMPAGFDVIVADATSFLNTPGKRFFDLIFLDPPHASADYDALCAALDQGSFMAEDALVYVEFSTPRASEFRPPVSWERYRSSRAGHLTFQLWRRAGGHIDPGVR